MIDLMFKNLYKYPLLLQEQASVLLDWI